MSDSVQQAGDRIEQLLAQVKALISPSAWERIDELMRLVVSLYGTGLEKIVAAVDDEVLKRLVADPLVASLLVLHGLHPEISGAEVEATAEPAPRLIQIGKRDASHPAPHPPSPGIAP